MKIENTWLPENGNIGIVSMSITYLQDNDINDTNNNGQFLTVEAQPVDNGFFLTIKTERWAVNEPNEITEILNDFIERLNYQNDVKKIKK